MLLFYVRHGDPIYSPDSLTPLGHRQAEAVAKRLALYGIDRVFSSDSHRAVLTATPTSELVKKPIEQLPFCNESLAWKDFAIDRGDGHHTWCFSLPEMKRQLLCPEVLALGERWYEHPSLARYEFGRGVERINREVDSWLATLGYEHDRESSCYRAVTPNDKRIALFAHQGFGLSFLSSLLDIPYPLFCTHFDMSHTGMTVIDFAQVDGIAIPKVLQLAGDSHLYREGLPTAYNNVLRF